MQAGRFGVPGARTLSRTFSGRFLFCVDLTLDRGREILASNLAGIDVGLAG